MIPRLKEYAQIEELDLDLTIDSDELDLNIILKEEEGKQDKQSILSHYQDLSQKLSVSEEDSRRLLRTIQRQGVNEQVEKIL